MRLMRQARRVDVQVSILMIVITVFCSLCIYAVCYRLTHSGMIHGLEQRAFAIHDFLEESLDKSTFYEINARADMEKSSYREMKSLLKQVKNASNVMYLYTAKKNEQGEFIYVIDGLDLSAGDFRYPGDPIEHEITVDMERALGGEQVLPKDIKSTDWGKIFITYFPVHDGPQVVGVVGIEFEAGRQFKTYSTIRWIVPVIVVLVSLLSTVTAVLVFRRVSNPTFHDMANTDQLTQLKNRNAFQTDIGNLRPGRSRQNTAMITIDLNDLKLVNDRLGHQQGDCYIQAAARAIRETVLKRGSAYRTGGDEYVILLTQTSPREIEALIDQIRQRFETFCREAWDDVPLSFSCGYAVYDESRDEDMMALFSRADEAMYEQKKAYHSMVDAKRL